MDGSVSAWGYNYYGELGDGTTTRRLTPVQVSGLSGAIAIAAGAIHSLAVKSDGTVWAWGANNTGQLGDATTANRLTPVQVSGLSGATAVAGGYRHSLALKSDGTVWAWGYNSTGQLGDATTANRITPVQVSGLSGATAVAGGYRHSLAIQAAPATPTPVSTSTPPATNTPTATPTATPTDTPTATPTDTPIPANTPSATPTDTPTATPTDTPIPSHTSTPTNTPTATPTNTPAATPTNTPMPTATPTITPTPTPANAPPVASAGPDQTVEQTSSQGATVTPDGAASSDDGRIQPLAFTWTWSGGSATGVSPTVTLPLGKTTLTLTVFDGQYSATDTVDITVRDTTPPTIAAPPDVTKEQASRNGTTVALGSPTVSDVCDANPAVTNDAPAVFPLGVTTVTWTATDASGNKATATQKVTIVDTTPPLVTITSPLPGAVHLADATIDVQYTVSDVCDAAPTVVVIPSDPIVSPLPVGDLVITVKATDASGNTGIASVTVRINPLPATLQIDPRTVNLKSGGRWITAYLELGGGYDVRNIDGATVKLNGVVPAYLGKEGWATAESNDANTADFDNDGKMERMVKFERAALQGVLSPGDKVQVTVSGKVSGITFEGRDFIKVINSPASSGAQTKGGARAGAPFFADRGRAADYPRRATVPRGRHEPDATERVPPFTLAASVRVCQGAPPPLI